MVAGLGVVRGRGGGGTVMLDGELTSVVAVTPRN
jgi:hypothetical protein